jgi:protein-S-isoprenylcysteine O-methyltransferase Ste14
VQVFAWIFRISVLVWLIGEIALRARHSGQRKRARTVEWRSFGMIIVCVLVGVFLADSIDYQLRIFHIPGPRIALLIPALLLLWAGIALRLWGINTLGRFFRGVVHVQEDHHVVRSGPYRYVRHPCYTGLLVAVVGLGLIYANVLSWIVLVIFVVFALLYRIRSEERMLTDALGTEYTEYAAQTKRLIPGVW